MNQLPVVNLKKEETLHDTQAKILSLAKTEGINGMSLREIAGKIGVKSAQLVKHHLEQLQKKGLIVLEK